MKEIALIGFAQTLFFSLLIVTKKKKEIKDYLIIIFLLFVGAELFYRYLLQVIPESEIKWMTLFDITYWALFGPTILMYIYFTINKVKKVNYLHLLHLIPLFISLFSIKNYYFGNSEYISFIDYFNRSTGITNVALLFWEFCTPLYIVYSLYVLIMHKKSLKEYFSNISKKTLKWLFLLLSYFAIFLLMSYIVMLMRVIFHVEVNFNSLGILPTILTAYVFFIGYYGYKQAGIFFDYPEKKNNILNKQFKIADNKYSKSGLSEIERDELTIKLKKVMETEKPYIEDNLNINMLAKMLNTSINKLSQVINETFDQNFYSFINTHRIEESKQLLKDPENEKYTIISIAYDCGFNSKSSFYNAFKQNTGITPKKYLEQQNIINMQ